MKKVLTKQKNGIIIASRFCETSQKKQTDREKMKKTVDFHDNFIFSFNFFAFMPKRSVCYA